MGKARKKAAETETRAHLELRPAMVDNPLWSRAYDGDKTNPRKITAIRNVKESPAAWLYAKGSIDESQLAAADQFRKLFETMGGTGARAIDWRREAVDGGRFPDPIGSQAIDAGKRLAHAYEVLTDAHGLYAWKLVGYICGEGKHVSDLTETRRQMQTMIDNLRMYLDCLAAHWNFASKRRVS
jgi:hypothetical protein